MLLNYLVNKPNRQIETQKFYQAQWEKPIYLRPRLAKAYLPVYGAAWTFAVGLAVFAASDLVLARNKKE